MIKIDYIIDELTTFMLVADNHSFGLNSGRWLNAEALVIGDLILSKNNNVAEITNINKLDIKQKSINVKESHNHHYFKTKTQSICIDNKAPSDPLELVAYELANKPSHFPNGEPTGYHSGPWVAAKYINADTGQETFAVGRACDKRCAEDAAVYHLKKELGFGIELNQKNVQISHAYIRKYTKKGRLVNTMSPCIHCRNNYGEALQDKTLGESDLIKSDRDYLPS